MEIPPPAFDALVLRAVSTEVASHVGAQFAGVRQLSREEVVLGLRHGRHTHHLLYSIHPHTARVHFIDRPEATERLGPFGLLLRSRLAEARLAAVEQPSFDRVLRLRFEALRGPLLLAAEIMGRHSNVVLADTGVVLGALKVVTPKMSPHRPVLPGRPYAAPPADRPRPDALTAAALEAFLANGGDTALERLLSQRLLGVSPLLAREVALRARLEPAAPASDALASVDRLWTALREICEVLRTGSFAPTLYEGEGRVAAFSAIPLRVYAGVHARPAASMSQAVARYYEGIVEAGPLQEQRRTLAASVQTALRKAESALERNREALTQARAAERLRVMGELLLAYGSRVRPGDTAVALPDHTAGGAEVVVPLDPTVTPVENARRLFRRYQKARAGAGVLPERIAQLEAEGRMLREALVQIGAATSADELWEVHADLAARGVLRRGPRSQPAAHAGPRRFRTPDGSLVLVGRSARENERVTFHLAGPDDLWFHARGVAGAHVVLKASGTPSEAGVTAAAQIAAYYSEGRHTGRVAVDCVARKHVRRRRGGSSGEVTYEEERTLLVPPALPPSR
jgi:predicted ribosome quality control (RQC) complex YloA/Tae2 family protein